MKCQKSFKSKEQFTRKLKVLPSAKYFWIFTAEREKKNIKIKCLTLSKSTEAQRSQIDLKRNYLHSCDHLVQTLHARCTITNLSGNTEDLTLKRGLNNVFSN